MRKRISSRFLIAFKKSDEVEEFFNCIHLITEDNKVVIVDRMVGEITVVIHFHLDLAPAEAGLTQILEYLALLDEMSGQISGSLKDGHVAFLEGARDRLTFL